MRGAGAHLVIRARRRLLRRRRLVARLVVAHCDARRDFVGHVGGDDFLILFQSSDWLERCRSIVDEFALEARSLFDDTARQAGGIHAEDRHGIQRFFPCTTLSMGAARIAPGLLRHAEEVANLAAQAKHEAKQAACGIVVLDAATGRATCSPEPVRCSPCEAVAA